jgi:hypothetical protein
VIKHPAYPPERYFRILRLAFLAALLWGSLNSVDGQEPLRGVPWQGTVSPWDPNSYQGQPRSATWWRGISDFAPTHEREPFFRIGALHGYLDANLGLHYTDNAGLTNTGTQDQLQLSQSAVLRVLWPFGVHNTLDLNLGAALTETIAGSRAGDVNFTLSPDSSIGLQFFIGDFRVRLFDRFAVLQDPTADSAVSGVVNLNRFRNNGGAAIDWNLDKVIVTLQVDDTYVTQHVQTANNLTEAQQQLSGVNGNRNTVRVALSAAAQLNPTLSFGPQVTLTETSATTGTDLEGLATGLFLRGQLTRLTSLSLEGGLNFVSEQGNHTPFVVQNLQKIPSTGYYVRAKANVRVTRFLQLTGEVSHDLDYGDGINLIERTVGDAMLSYRLTKRLDLTVGGRYEDGNVLTGVNQGRYSLYQINAGLTRQLGPRIRASLDYRFIQRTSGNNNVVVLVDGQRVSLPSQTGNYTQNLFLINVSYAF